MNKELFIKAMSKFILGVLLVALLLFPTGTLHYWHGWVFMTILFVPMFIAGMIMMFYNPVLLEKRLNAKEKEMEQKQVVAFSGLMFLISFILAGFNYRWNWFILPNGLVWISVIIFLLSYLMYAEVLRENTFLSRTIEIQDNQKVIDTGLYSIVRHPMYSSTLLLFLSMPLVLGSPISFLIILLSYIPLINKRMNNEEKVLKEGLNGYMEYQKKVKYKVIPFIW
ncbi:Mn2+-dependent serine/threonine protein kinase [Anaeromyces robustus]|uniref:Protein-S-isoprenylcysteine O-methyltransferase n=1 Tax=Anaeromyces robustus TaxID=1754192 RepID=A0A1Y1XQD9_9FUNG|nr:Mn2+-dependent serine/threonine protein kinase [Anaeromyces robustus]|eukprot:ORX87951.1 Mn2+-dependent serine/threonine protein kinase [Anaeromyces robustus]